MSIEIWLENKKLRISQLIFIGKCIDKISDSNYNNYYHRNAGVVQW